MGTKDFNCDALILLEVIDGPKEKKEIRREVTRKYSDATFYRWFDRLEERGKIVELEDGRYALFDFERGVEEKVMDYLREWSERYPDLEVAPPPEEIAREAGISNPSHEALKKVRERMLKEGFDPSPPITQESRREHTSELKRVIRKWIDLMQRGHHMRKTVAEIEGFTLFPDLEFHLHSGVFGQWREFKALVEEYRSLRREMTSRIKEEIEEVGREEPFFLPPDRPLEGEADELLEVSIDALKRRGVTLSEEIGERLEGENKTSGGTKGEDASPTSDDRVVGRIIGSLDLSTDREDTDEEKEKRIDLYQKVVGEVIRKEGKKVESLSELYGDLNALEGRIIGELRRHLSIPSFPGCCQYLVGELSQRKTPD